MSWTPMGEGPQWGRDPTGGGITAPPDCPAAQRFFSLLRSKFEVHKIYSSHDKEISWNSNKPKNSWTILGISIIKNENQNFWKNSILDQLNNIVLYVCGLVS